MSILQEAHDEIKEAMRILNTIYFADEKYVVENYKMLMYFIREAHEEVRRADHDIRLLKKKLKGVLR